jgi:Xaa-Pro dipeptidase
MPLHFSEAELAGRRDRACQLLAEAGLDGLLIFRQESMYYLTGYDTFGYVFFQCLYLGADGRLMLLTRSADRRQAEQTSVVKDIRIWVDGPEANPAVELRGILEAFGCAGRAGRSMTCGMTSPGLVMRGIPLSHDTGMRKVSRPVLYSLP